MKYYLDKMKMQTVLAALDRAIEWEENIYVAHCDPFSRKPAVELKRECRCSIKMQRKFNDLRLEILQHESIL